MSINHTVFPVGETSYCMWDHDIKAINLEYINSINPSYYEYIGGIHCQQLDGEQKQLAATVLRLTYHQALETFFALICATLQAPNCVVGWMQKYKPAQLRQMVREVNSGNPSFLINLKLDHVDWESIALKIIQFRSQDEKRNLETKQLFGKAWIRLARDFVEEYASIEYNSIKHGLRANPGGFELAFAIEKEYGVPPPSDQFQILGSSEFGNSFLRAEQILKENNSPHFRISRSSVAWNPESTAFAIMLLAKSIQNLSSFLKLLHGVDPTTFHFVRFTDDEVFQKPWTDSPSVNNFSMNYSITENDINKYPRKQLDELLQNKLHKQNDTAG